VLQIPLHDDFIPVPHRAEFNSGSLKGVQRITHDQFFKVILKGCCRPVPVITGTVNCIEKIFVFNWLDFSESPFIILPMHSEMMMRECKKTEPT
jgi:hypothetical protein